MGIDYGCYFEPVDLHYPDFALLPIGVRDLIEETFQKPDATRGNRFAKGIINVIEHCLSLDYHLLHFAYLCTHKRSLKCWEEDKSVKK